VKSGLTVTLLLGAAFAGLGGSGLAGFWADRWWGEVQYRAVDIPPGLELEFAERTGPWAEATPLTRALFAEWADRPLVPWEETGRGSGQAARIALARLQERRELDETNAFLLAARPWGRSGSTWVLHRRGGYNFTLLPLTTILWLFGDQPEVLYPATRQHLLDVLLIEDGGAFRTKVPRSLGLVSDTENHLLMTESARYLKNHWLRRHGAVEPRYDNAANGLEARLLALLAKLRREGLYEFNSQPYIAYSLSPLLNLEAFAAEPVRAAARALLDELNWAYAHGSLELRHFPPFRRRDDRAGETSLHIGYQTAFMRVWASRGGWEPAHEVDLGRGGQAHALFAAALPYRPPDAVLAALHDKGRGYLVQLGHGPESSPEIYAAGRDYLLSAGGVHRGARSLLVARPTVLFLRDGATTLDEVFHLAGPGSAWRGWNNTGVHHDFAVAAGPVHVPAGARLHAEADGWRQYVGAGELGIVVYQRTALGLLALFPAAGTADLLPAVMAANPDGAALASRFRFPDGRELNYDPGAPAHLGVMTGAEGRTLDREFDRWPRHWIEPRKPTKAHPL
jgi:hypothetical protein